MLSRDMKDRRIGFVTVTDVRLNPDLKHARVFISMMGSEETKQETLQALRHAAGWARHELGQRIRTKFTPEIEFLLDTSEEYGKHIDDLLGQIHQQEEE